MFNFFKKKENKESLNSKKNETNSEIENSELIQEQIDHLSIKINELEISDESVKDELSSLYEKRGLLYFKLNEFDQSISDLENQMKLKPSIGDSYKTLLNLYNKKRAQAAQKGSDEEINYYMNKLDELRQIAKIGTVS